MDDVLAVGLFAGSSNGHQATIWSGGCAHELSLTVHESLPKSLPVTTWFAARLIGYFPYGDPFGANSTSSA